jgi:two-component system NtrC family sensor kinase
VKHFTEELAFLEVDADQLRQVIMNLVLNGAAAMESGGELVISTKRDKDTIKIAVRDTGKGIAPGSLKEVYEPFYTTKEKGTGLGLAISRQIVEAHLGSMEIESTLGTGTTVTVTLPATSGGGI